MSESENSKAAKFIAIVICTALFGGFLFGAIFQKWYVMRWAKGHPQEAALISSNYNGSLVLNGPLKTNYPSSRYSEVLVTNWHDLPPDGPFLLQYGTVKKELWQDSSWAGGNRHELMESNIIAQLPPRACEIRTNKWQGVVEKVVVGTSEIIALHPLDRTNWIP